MDTPSTSPRASGTRSFVLTVLIGGLAFGTAGFACAPASWRLTTPITCPAGTTDSAVVSHVERNAKGSIVTQFELYCIDADGGATAPWGAAIFGVMALYGAAVALVLALVRLARRRLGVATAMLAALMLGGCEVGTLTRDEFAALHPYGGGPMFSRGRAEAAARALEARLGGPQRVTGVTLAPDTVSFSVLGRGGVDVFTYREDGFAEPSPVQSSSDDSPAQDAFPLRPADLARVTSLVHDAPRLVGIDDGHVTSVSLTKDGETLELHLDVASPHRRGSARFDVRGTLLEARID